jgi:hypothetical protein
MLNSQPPSPRQIAGKLNRSKRKGLTADGRQRLRSAALANQPWTRSTGPKTVAGKAQAAANGKARQTASHSVRELRAMTADARRMIEGMVELRRTLATQCPTVSPP